MSDKPIPQTGDVVLFVSFDIVGSTAFKAEREDWVLPLRKAIGSISLHFELEQVMNSKIEWRTWKFNGDELLYYKHIDSIINLAKSIRYIYSARPVISRLIKEHASEVLDVKATAWLVLLDEENNLWLEDTKDFMGIHIDQGFRIAQNFAKPGRLAVSFEIAYLLTSFSKGIVSPAYQSNVEKYFFLLGYEQLKGVWKGRGYPIIWYSENAMDDLHNTPFDAEINSPLFKIFEEKVRDRYGLGSQVSFTGGNVGRRSISNKTLPDEKKKLQTIASEIHHLDAPKRYLSKLTTILTQQPQISQP